MKYSRFEDLPVWQAGMNLAERVFTCTADKAFAFQGDLANQLQRAGLSIGNNIAEGFERGTTSELLAFLYYARGSAGEVRSMLLLMERLARFAHLRSEISDLKSLAESVSRQLRAWADALQNSPIQGQRHLTDATRRRDEEARRRQEFDVELERIVQEGRRKIAGGEATGEGGDSGRRVS
ncbi:MAG: four helix bundle protein [Planctomycetota bacterium]|nr:four helix bundle protein [Planctomycetota bacterium]